MLARSASMGNRIAMYNGNTLFGANCSSAVRRRNCRSMHRPVEKHQTVLEFSLGKGEVVSSILTGSTSSQKGPRNGAQAMSLFTRRVWLAALSLLLPIDEVNAATEPGWLPDRATIDKIEAALVMPDGASPLFAYRRRYGGAIEDDRRIIWGVFVLAAMAPGDGEITILNHRPVSLLQDGGCLVVTLKFDVDSDRLLWIQCNGQA